MFSYQKHEFSNEESVWIWMHLVQSVEPELRTWKNSVGAVQSSPFTAFRLPRWITNLRWKCAKNFKFSCCCLVRTTWLLKHLLSIPEYTATNNSTYFKFAAEKWLELLLKAECKRKPSHIRSISPLPKINDALEIILRIIVFILCIWFNLSSRDPISTKKDIAISTVKMANVFLWQSNELFVLQHECFHCLKDKSIYAKRIKNHNKSNHL